MKLANGKFILLIWLLAVSGTFSGSFSQNVEVISFSKIRKNKEEVKLSYFGESVKYIKLETNDYCLLGRIAWCRKAGDRIVVLDRTTKLYFIFDLNGKFINKVGNVGKGPSEYFFNERSSYVNAEDQLIGIYDQGKTSYLEFNLNGDCVKEFRVESNPEHVLNLKNKYVFFHPLCRRILNDWFTLSIVSPSGNLLHKAQKDSLNEIHSDAYRSFYKFGDEIHFWETQIDTVYSFDGEWVKPIYILDLGKDKMPNEIWLDISNINEKSSKYATILSLLETSSFLFFVIKDLEHQGKFVLWDKTKKSGYWVGRNKTFRRLGYENDIDGSPIFKPSFLFSDDQIGQVLEVTTLKEYLENGLIKPYTGLDGKSNQELIEMIEKSSINDNPIIQIVQIKKSSQ